MGKRNRARTRAVRAEMATTGDAYTRAAARAGHTSPPQTGGSATDAVREHICRVLEASNHDDQARLRRVEELERDGHRIVGGGQTSADGWEISDWRTGELLAQGVGGLKGFDAETDRLDPDGKWFHCDHVSDDVPSSEIETPGIPVSLGYAIQDWLAMLATSDEEVAEFIGWPVERVRALREEDRG